MYKRYDFEGKYRFGSSSLASFYKIKPKKRLEKQVFSEIRFLLKQSRYKIKELDKFISGKRSLDSCIEYSNLDEFFRFLYDCFYYHLNIKDTEFILVGDTFPNTSISELENATCEKELCDNYFELLKSKVRELFISAHNPSLNTLPVSNLTVVSKRDHATKRITN